MWDQIVGIVRSHPWVVDLGLLLAVLTHGVLTYLDVVPNVWGPFSTSINLDNTLSIYLSALGPASIVTGFAGVVVVFALSASGERFRTLRVMGGRHLTANWLATTVSGFVACVSFMTAAILTLWSPRLLPAFIFEFGLVILTHGAIRLLWQLSKVVVAEDNVRSQPRTPSAEELFPKKNFPPLPKDSL